MGLYQISLFFECFYLLRNYTGQKAASCWNQMTTAYFLDVFTFSIQKQAVRQPWTKGRSLDTLGIFQEDGFVQCGLMHNIFPVVFLLLLFIPIYWNAICEEDKHLIII